MIDDLRRLAVFARVVELGSFRAAATSLALAPSVVSHHVAALEAQLGLPLLYRTTRRHSLTQHGERLFQAAQHMLKAAEAGLDEVAGRSRQPVGRLRVTAPAVLAAAHLVDDLAAFAAAHPGVELSVDFSDVRRDLVGDGIDLAIRMGRMADSTLRSRKLAVIPDRLFAAPAYVAGRPRPRRPADLADWDWLRLGAVHRHARLRHASGASETVATRSRIEADSAEAIYRLARAGLGLALVPAFLGEEDVASGRMVEVLPSWRPAPIMVFAVWPANVRRGNLTMRLVETLIAREAMRGG